MNPLLSFPSPNESLRYRRRPSFSPGRFPPTVSEEPARGALAWDDWDRVAGTDPVAKPSTLSASSGHIWKRNPNWSGVLNVTDNRRVRHNSGSIAFYVNSCDPGSDQRVSAKLFFTAGFLSVSACQIGVMARVSPSQDTGYYFLWNVNTSRYELDKRVAGTGTALNSYTPAIDPTDQTQPVAGDQKEITLECIGKNIRCYVDGILRISVTDSAIPSGQAGIWAFTPVANGTGVHLGGWSVHAAESVISGGGGTKYFPGGVVATRTNGGKIWASGFAGSGQYATYQWYRSTVAGFRPSRATRLAQRQAVLEDRGAQPNTNYYYRVAVADSLGRSDLSPEFTLTTLDTSAKRAACIGDSLTWGIPLARGQDYPSVLASNLGNPWTVVNHGVPSQTTSGLALTAPTDLRPFSDPALAKNICVVWAGTNDLAGNLGATISYNNFVALCNLVRSWGFKVVVCTIIDRQQGGLPAGFQTDRATVNTNIVNNFATFADALADLAANANLSDATNLTYFQSDKTHLTAAGYSQVASLVQTAVTSL